MSIYGSVPSLLPADVQDLSTAVYKGVFGKPSLEQFHGVRTGIKGATRIPIMGGFSGLLGSIKADCDTTADVGSISTTAKQWSPKYISGRVTMCYEDLMGTYAQWLMANGLAKENLQNTGAFAQYATEMIGDALNEAVLRLAWLGDTGLSAGDTNGIDSGNVKYFTPIDGFWKQLVAIATSDTSKRIIITKNTGDTIANQAFTGTDTTNQVVTGYFTSAHRNADLRLKSKNASEKIIIATDSMCEQYRAERKLASGIDAAYNRVENGIDTLMCDGVEVVPFSLLDRYLKAYFQVTASSKTTVINPHRFVLTTRAALANLLIATEQTANLQELKVEYNSYHKTWFADYGFMLDAKVANDDAVMVGY